MKLKSKLTATIVSMCAAIAVMGVGVWASTSQSFRLTVQNDIDIKINSVIADVWGEYAVYTEMMEEVNYQQTVTDAYGETTTTTVNDKVPGLLRWRTAESALTWKSDPVETANDMIGAQADGTANNCYILYTQYGNGYNDGENIVYNEDADWDKYNPSGDGLTYPNQTGNYGQDGDDLVGGTGNEHKDHLDGDPVNNPNATQPGNWKDVFVPGHDYSGTNNPLPYSAMMNSGLKNYLNFANFQYLDSGDTGSLPGDPHPNIPYPDTYYNIDYTTSYAQIVYMYTIRQYYVPGADNTIYLTVQDEVTDAFAQEITDTAGLSRVQRNYYINYNGEDEYAEYDIKTDTSTKGDVAHPNNTTASSSSFYDTYDSVGDVQNGGSEQTCYWAKLEAGVKALAGEAGSDATADTIREAATHYELPNPNNNGAWAENKDHIWHVMCVYTFERTSTNVDLSGLADGIGHSLSLLTSEQLEQYYEIPADQIATQTVKVGNANSVEGTGSKASFSVNKNGSDPVEIYFNVAMKDNVNFAFAGRDVNGRPNVIGRSPVTFDNYRDCNLEEVDDDQTSLTNDELSTGFKSSFGIIEKPNGRYAFRFSDMVREYGGAYADGDWYDLFEPTRITASDAKSNGYQGIGDKTIENIQGTPSDVINP